MVRHRSLLLSLTGSCFPPDEGQQRNTAYSKIYETSAPTLANRYIEKLEDLRHQVDAERISQDAAQLELDEVNKIASLGNALAVVCLTWRQIILASHVLWSRSINYVWESPHWTEKMLNRSGIVPLIVEVEYAGTHPWSAVVDENLKLVFKQIHRIQVLKLAVASHYLRMLVERLILPAPLLESLTLFGHGGKICDLPTSIFALHIPRLIRLHIQNCRTELGSPLFSKLLKVKDPLLLSDIQTSQTTSFTSLNAQRNFVLELHASPPRFPGLENVGNIGVISQVTSMRMSGSPIEIFSRLINHLHFSSAAMLAFDCIDMPESKDSISHFLVSIKEVISRGFALRSFRLRISSSRDGTWLLTVVGWAGSGQCRLEFDLMRTGHPATVYSHSATRAYSRTY
jgi:hypothetical protein